MRDQYAGDISDLLKLSLLRTLAADDKTLSVGWYYNPSHDGRPDGGHREYCRESKWQSLDLPLWNALKDLSERSVSALEKLPIWPARTRFHGVPVPSVASRQLWAADLKTALQGSNIIFLDPDNGVGTQTERHATFSEIESLRQPSGAVVLIKFPGHANHRLQLEEHHGSLRDQTQASSIATVSTCVWLNQPRFRWFTIIDGDDALIERARLFARKVNAIERCKAELIEGSSSAQGQENRVHLPVGSMSTRTPMSNPVGAAGKVCPECGHQFKGNGFDGIDAHWRSKHEAIMPYATAWPLIKSGKYSS
jgi:hypothetical protein